MAEFNPDDYTLQAFHGQVLVGLLRVNPTSDEFGFDYDPAWIRNPGAFQLSPHIRFDAPAPPVTVRRFIENLLPEGQALDVAATYANVSKGNVFGLIHALGKESAGALRFLPVGAKPSTEAVRRLVTHEELQQRIQERDSQPFVVWDGRVRISIAGYQDKLQVVRQEDRLYLVDGALSSTHILKPEPRNPRLPFMVANEHFCMRLVNRIAQRRLRQDWAARVDILRVPDAVLCVERFDRELQGDQTRSFHILDACQALDRPVAHKYERNIGHGADVRHIHDGVSFQALASLRADRHLVDPTVQIRQIAMWALTTLLLGNSDAHGKNLSFFARHRLLEVAPFYDLVCTAVYKDAVEQELAMAFGDEFDLDAVKSFALADFAQRLGWPRRTFARELVDISRLAREEAAAQVDDEAYSADERALVRQIAAHVDESAQSLMAFAPDIPKLSSDLF
ncbi:MAG: HipA domain-containing protein [Proteobacteria bacterium]|nr:HipA domain-containing protein [Pseudomonadota bacterium]